jgi:nucleoside-diphosphate-sugar epimerase
MNKIGITGAAGVLGKLFAEKLEQNNLEYNCFNGDICSKEDILRWLTGNTFDAVIHFAAIVSTAEVKNNPKKAYSTNVIGTKNLIDVINSSNQSPWLFYASTSHVYASKNSPISEDDTISPVSEYGKTKFEAEKIVSKYYNNFCIGRIFSFYHDSQKKPFLYPNIKKRLKNENLSKPFELYGAQSVRDFLNAEDVANIIIELMDKKTEGIYNIASGKGIEIKDFVQNLTNKKLDIKESGTSDYLVADISKLENILK